MVRGFFKDGTRREDAYAYAQELPAGFGLGQGCGGVGDRPRGPVQQQSLPHVAERLADLKGGLPDSASSVFAALRQALLRFSRPNGARPCFDKDFHESLSALLPDAWDISSRQMGSWNQWEVTIDRGQPIYCSVRLVVLRDNGQDFLRELKSKARVVKELLLEKNAMWKNTLQPEQGSFNFDKLSQFEHECVERARGATSAASRGGIESDGFAWVDPRDACKTCGKHTDEDQLSGEHVCVVIGQFVCGDCQHAWSSHHARLKPDGTLMGQKCSRCSTGGASLDWRLPSSQEDSQPRNSFQQPRPKAGAHQSHLCDACLEYGDCMGVFYDPFILTTALSLVSGTNVQWRTFSEEMPELLVADLGPNFQSLEICLQPHVYTYCDEKGKQRDSRTGGWKQSAWDKSAAAPAQESNPSATGKVKNANVLARFLSGKRGAKPGDSSDERGTSDGPRAFLDDLPAPSVMSGGSSASVPVSSVPVSSLPKTSGSAGDEAGGPHGLSESNDDPSTLGTEDVAPVGKNKFNKIGKAGGPADSAPPAEGEGGSSSSAAAAPAQVVAPPPATPLLDTLPPLRRAQFLQVVLRRVKACGSPESDKFSLSEMYLKRFEGDYDQAYNYVKSLTSTPGMQ